MTIRSSKALALGLGLVMAPVARAEPTAIVQQEINYLIRYIGDSGCEFRRNGTWNFPSVWPHLHIASTNSHRRQRCDH
jgi:hypothetical protein